MPRTSPRSSVSGATMSPRPASEPPTQTEIARFWVESSPLQWNRIARNVAADQRARSPWEQARLFGLLDMALADGYIGSFETKYLLYNYWRPVTAIREAATDGNPNTSADPTWTPLVPTPPIPDHDSAHHVPRRCCGRRSCGESSGLITSRFRTCSLTLPSGQHVHRPHTGRRAGTVASPRRRTRMACHASSSGSTSGTLSMTASNTAAGSARARSTGSCAPCADRASDWASKACAEQGY